MIETSGKPPTTHRSLSSPAHQALPAPDAPAGEGDEPGIAWSAGPTGVASSSPTPPIDENGDDDGADSEKTTNDGAGQDKEVAQVVVLEQEAQGARLIDRVRALSPPLPPAGPWRPLQLTFPSPSPLRSSASDISTRRSGSRPPPRPKSARVRPSSLVSRARPKSLLGGDRPCAHVS